MELDDDTKQKIEALIGKKISETDSVSGLLNVPETAAKAAIHLFSQHGYSILAILYLRYLSGCGLKEAVDFLGRNNGGIDG